MSYLIYAFICSLSLSFFLGLAAIPVLKRIKCGQPILKYVETHKNKSGTPTMGGLFFISSASVIYLIFAGVKNRLAIVSLTIGIAYMLVRFLDDFIKVKFAKNEGLKPYQKIIFQTLIAVFSGVFAYVNGMTDFFIPFSMVSIDLGWFTVPFIAVIFLAITNSVNLTDGLDGLAGSVSAIYLAIISLIIFLQSSIFSGGYPENEYKSLILLSICLIGGISGFLIFNVSKAKVFMGDTGSLSLGGFIGAISIFSANSFFIPIIGIMFVSSSISVILQVVHFKRTKRRIFLMAPLHHHFQMKGYSESKIAFCYSIVTLVFGLACTLTYL